MSPWELPLLHISPEPLTSLFIYLMTCFPPVAIKTMNKVASHINEMQKIHEEFGAVFDQLIAEQTGEKKEVRTPLLPSMLVCRAGLVCFFLRCYL